MTHPSSSRSIATMLSALLCAAFAGVTPAGDDPVLYVGVWSEAKIYRYGINPNGNVGGQKGTALAVPGDARDMIVAPNQQYLYFASVDLTTYEIVNTNGKLSFNSTAPIGNGTFDDLALHGGTLYGTHSKGGGRLYVFDVGSGAPITAPIQEATTPLDPHGVAVSPDGEFVFVANGTHFIVDPPETHEISSFPVNTDGTVVDGGSGYSVTGSDSCPDYFAVAENPSDPGAAILYHTERPGSNLISQSSNGTTGVVSFEESSLSGFGATQLIHEPETGTVYVVNLNDETVSAFDVAGSSLTKLGDYPTGDRPKHLIAYKGFLYVVNAGDLGEASTISVYEIEATGELVPQQTKVIDGVTGDDQGGYRLAIYDPLLPAVPPPIFLNVSKNPGLGEDVDLDWTEQNAAYDIFHATDCSIVMEEHLDTTTATSYTHTGSAQNGLSCYVVTASP